MWYNRAREVIKMNSKYNYYLNEVEKLHSEGKMNFEISKIIDVDSRRVSDLLKKLGLRSNKQIFNESVTEIQNEVFVSMAIGDGSIYRSRGNINYRMNLAHCEKQKEYFITKYKIIQSFIGVDYTFNTQYDKRTEKEYYHYKLQTKVNPYFTRLYERFYKDGKKVIPSDLIDDITPRILAYKYFDDGSKIRKAHQIAMNGYDEESILNFIMILKKKFGIESTKHSGGAIYIPKRCSQKFIKIIKPYATSDVLYKLGELMETPNA